jgi:hypothetical protein
MPSPDINGNALAHVRELAEKYKREGKSRQEALNALARDIFAGLVGGAVSTETIRAIVARVYGPSAALVVPVSSGQNRDKDSAGAGTQQNPKGTTGYVQNADPALGPATIESRINDPGESENGTLTTQTCKNTGESGSNSAPGESEIGSHESQGITKNLKNPKEAPAAPVFGEDQTPPLRGRQWPTTVKERRERQQARPPDTRLPVPEYVPAAAREYLRYLPPREEWQTQLFYFVRLIKAHPRFAHLRVKTALQKVESILGDWEWTGQETDEAREDFLYAWDRVRVLPGRAPLDNAVELARRYPIKLPAKFRKYRSDTYEHFVGLAGWLQVAAGDRPIFLPVHELARRLQTGPMTIVHYRDYAQEDGFLREVNAAAPGRATEFRFDVSKFDILQKHARKKGKTRE